MGSAVMPTAAGKNAPQMLPFRRGTRRRVATIGTVPVTPGQAIPTVTLPQVGMLSKIYIFLSGTITQSGAGTVSPLGYASLINRVRVNANLGSASIVDVSGIGLEIVNDFFAPTAGIVKNTYANAGAANLVRYGVCIPITANDRDQFTFGMINLQAAEVRVTLDVIFNALASFVTLTTASSLTLTIAYEYWDIPNPARYAMPPKTLVRTLEDAPLPITTTGDQIYQLPRLGTLAQLAELVLINGTFAVLQQTGAAVPPQVNEFRMRINRTDTVLDYLTPIKEIEECLFYNAPGASFLRQGVLTWDFFHASQQTRNGGDARDFIDTESITTLESIATIDPTVTITGLCQIQPIRRVLQRLV